MRWKVRQPSERSPLPLFPDTEIIVITQHLLREFDSVCVVCQAKGIARCSKLIILAANVAAL